MLLSAIAAKVLGACFKIPLTNVLGGTGMGYFSCAYGLLLPVYALSVAGISTSACYLLLLLLILWNLRRILGQSLGLLRPLFPVFLSAVCCTATAALCRNFFYQAAPLFLTTVCCTAGGCIYLLLLWFFGGKKRCRH